MISYGTTEALAHPQPPSCTLLIKRTPGVSWASRSLSCSFAHATQKTLNGVVLPSAPRIAMQVLTGDPSAAVRDPASQALACFRLGSALLISPAVLGHTHTPRCCVRVSFRTESPLQVSLYLHCVVAQRLREAILDKLSQDLTVSHFRYSQPVPPSFCTKPYGAHILLAPAQRERQRERGQGCLLTRVTGAFCLL